MVYYFPPLRQAECEGWAAYSEYERTISLVSYEGWPLNSGAWCSVIGHHRVVFVPRVLRWIMPPGMFATTAELLAGIRRTLAKFDGTADDLVAAYRLGGYDAACALLEGQPVG